MCQNTLRVGVLTLLLVSTLEAFSQSLIFGKVQDAFLKIPLPETKVSLLLAADSTIVIDSIPIRKSHREDGTVREAGFSFKPERKTCKYLLRGRLNGYEDGYLPLSIDENESRPWMLDGPLELLRVRQVNLDEVVVKATKVKMYWKGDTLVYDATAFQLSDGSMLDDLIRQMPGVTMNDVGEIFVNGRKIDELQLGSRSFMRGNKEVMLKNLPYYTVKNIKVYEQDTDLNRALNAKVEQKKFVMDVNLKPEYQKGYIANVEAAGSTEERWLGRAFLLGFMPQTRYTFLANSNNVNESCHIGSSDHWTPNSMPKSLLTTNSVAGEIDYQSFDKNVQENLTVGFTSTRNNGELIKRYELFLPGSPLLSTHEKSMTKANQLKIGNSFKYIKPQGLMFDSNLDLNYKSYSGNTFALAEQFVDTLTTHQRTDGFNDGETWAAKFYAKIQPSLRNIGGYRQFFNLSTHFDYKSDENQNARGFRIDDFANLSSVKSYNSNEFSNRNIAVRTPIGYGVDGRIGTLSINVAPLYSREKKHDWMYHPDTLMLSSQIDMLQAITDGNNSYDSELQSYGGEIELQVFRDLFVSSVDRTSETAENYLDLYMQLKPMHEKLRYQRGTLDTVAIRNTVRFQPTLNINLFVKNDPCRPAKITIGHYEYNSSLINQIGFRDDATPLVVRLGNPDIKPYLSTSYLQAEYKDVRTSRRHINLFTRAAYIHNDVSQAVSFDPSTGVYTYRPENTHGTYDIKARAGIFYTLDKNRFWSVENNFDGNFVHFLDHAMLSGETESHINAVNTLTLHDNAYIQYSRNKLNIRATGDINWRHSEGKMYDFSTLNAFDFRYGLSARYTIPRLNTTLSVDGTMYSRRGYGSSDLNTNDFVMNASLSQSFLKGKIIAKIEAFDILHQLSSTQYNVNAQGRTETWHRSLPHYVMLHFVYHWNKNPRK